MTDAVWLRLLPGRTIPGGTAGATAAATWLGAVQAALRRPVQLLLVGVADDVGIWLRVAEPDRLTIAATVLGSYPDSRVVAEAPHLATTDAQQVVAVRWGLAAGPLLPLRCRTGAGGVDALPVLLAVLASAGAGHTAVVSLVLRPGPVRQPERAARLAARLRQQRHPRDGAQPLLDKAAQPLFRVTLRTGWLAPDAAAARAGHRALAAALHQLDAAGSNGVRILHRERSSRTWPAIALGRAARWERLVLGVDELAALVHLPAGDLLLPHLRRAGSRRLPPEPAVLSPGLHLADASAGSDATAVGPSVGQLMTHAYVVGPSGTGKTSLLATLVLELAQARTAAVVLDPHGDLVGQVLERLPSEHLGRTKLLDLADPARLPSVNPLWLPAAPPEGTAVARATRSAAATAVFADIWGLDRASTPNLLSFLEAGLAALVGCGTGCLAQLPRLLTDGSFRAGVVRAAGDPRVSARWAEFAALSRDERSRTVRAILNKAADFDRNPIVGTVFGDPGPGLRLEQVMDHHGLLLVSLPRGLVPEGTVELVGSVLVSLLYQSALARESRPPEDRPPVVAVIDEFQEFALSTFAKVVTAARKYGLGLVLANQNLSRLRVLAPDLLETVLANVGTLALFRTGPADAARLAGYVDPYTADDLAGLAPFESYWRLPGRDGPVTVAARTRPPGPALRDRAAVAALSTRLRLPGRPMQAAAGPAPDWGP